MRCFVPSLNKVDAGVREHTFAEGMLHCINTLLNYYVCTRAYTVATDVLTLVVPSAVSQKHVHPFTSLTISLWTACVNISNIAF